MTLGDLVRCSGGLHVALRGAAGQFAPPSMYVGDINAIDIPVSPPVEARTRDSVVWRRHWWEPDRLVIDFVNLSNVEVDDLTGRVTFDRLLAPDMEEHLLLDHVLPLVLARRGELVLHGAVISIGAAGAVLVGTSGAGKSTFTAFAWQRGWCVGGDDGAVIRPSDPATVEPTYPTIRVTPATAALLGIRAEDGAPIAGKTRLFAGDDMPFRQAPVDLGIVAIVTPVPAGGLARFEPLTGMDAHVELFRATFHADLGGHRLLGPTVDQLARVVEAVTVGRLYLPRGIEGLAAAETLLRTMIQAPQQRDVP